MNRQPQRFRTRLWHAWLAGALLFAAGPGPMADAQTPSALVPSALPAPNPAQITAASRKVLEGQEPPMEKLPAPGEMPVPAAEAAPVSSALGCAGCSAGGCGPGGCGGCVPGRFRDCCGCNSDGFFGKIICGFYRELCCPDPCYEPTWIPAANAAFFVEGTRPVTTTRIRWDYARDWDHPDRAEFIFAQPRATGGKGPANKESSLSYSQLTLYQEVAAKGFSFFFEMNYLSIDPDNNPHAAGFGDMRLGTKSLLFDRDMFQLGFMFTTFVPSGNFTVGLGTGHVALEPSLLGTLKITPDTYFQTQLSEWIPIGGDGDFQGSIFHYHFSLNHVLWRPIHNVELIGTGEFVGYSFQAGQFSVPGQPNNNAHPGEFFYTGPGLRLVVCEWIDFGFAVGFGFGGRGPEELYRTELRIRY